MRHNPYSAPTADLSTTPAVIQEKKTKSAWLTQIICTVFGISLCVGITRTTTALVVNGVDAFGNVSLRTVSFHLFVRVVTLIVFVITVVGIQTRKTYGKICGGVVIGIMLAWFGYQLLFVEGKATANGAEAIGEFTAKMLAACGTGYWLYAFCFSPRAQRYFSSDNDVVVENN